MAIDFTFFSLTLSSLWNRLRIVQEIKFQTKTYENPNNKNEWIPRNLNIHFLVDNASFLQEVSVP